MRHALLLAIGLTWSCGFPNPAHSGDASGSGTDAREPDGDGPATRMCDSLPKICGPDHTSSCCTSSVIPGGQFYRGYDAAVDQMYKTKVFRATVRAFRLDTYEVTVGRFRQFVEAGMGTQVPSPHEGSGARTLGGMPNQGGWDLSWNQNLPANTPALKAALNCGGAQQTWTDDAGSASTEALPIDCITWYEAFAFCVWDGGFLPTDAEWEYAAGGGSDQRAYPWSQPASDVTIDCSHANFDPQPANTQDACVGGMKTVGGDPAGDGKWGQADLAGNVWEWSLDSYEVANGQDYYPTPCDNCADFASVGANAMHGGAAFYGPNPLRVDYRFWGYPATTYRSVGVRCAREP
jgi:formylglycine-generating enzyme required for sulfatase activity